MLAARDALADDQHTDCFEQGLHGNVDLAPKQPIDD
jgi:hypothetical protein